MNEQLAAIPTDQGVRRRETGTSGSWRDGCTAGSPSSSTTGTRKDCPPGSRQQPHCWTTLARFGLLGQHKYLPYRAWFRNELHTYMHEVLTDSRTRRNPFWNADGLARVASDHTSGRRNCLREIHAVLALDAVERTLLQPEHHHGFSAGARSRTLNGYADSETQRFGRRRPHHPAAAAAPRPNNLGNRSEESTVARGNDGESPMLCLGTKGGGDRLGVRLGHQSGRRAGDRGIRRHGEARPDLRCAPRSRGASDVHRGLAWVVRPESDQPIRARAGR